MLRQRNIVRVYDVFIGDVEEPVQSYKEKKTGQSEGGSWKHLSLLMLCDTGESN